ncbi:hypothetical protein JHK85_004098 [Glycine max]|uniref:Protein SRG1 isoform D n=1 Tax=Glycine soja TaxID=3848 RepID=A0A445LP14_GLYSO|nr:hypothetical protein JHK87_003793 [Glycine soja]KAG5062915.1 hypothetical protein JHK85_004098 [Glycine max]RZC24667.1 Protein SRG1 isoform D [Glycine soja]
MFEFGTSVLVPSVQELAKQAIINVPEKYLRPNQDSHVIVDSTLTLPLIDLSKLLSEDVTELEKLNNACKEWGFFQVINHGVIPSLVENVKRDVQEFLNLPMEKKKQFWQTPDEIEGFGQLFVASEDQKLEWADMFLVHTLPINARNPRLFPNFPQPLRDNLENYSLELKKLCLTIIERMTIALKIEPNELLDYIVEDLFQSMRWNYYPPCPQPENILTNGIYRSIEHRVTINSEKERISIATFHRPHVNRVIGPTPSFVTSERPAVFKRITVGDYYRAYSSRELNGKSCLDFIRIPNEISK